MREGGCKCRKGDSPSFLAAGPRQPGKEGLSLFFAPMGDSPLPPRWGKDSEAYRRQAVSVAWMGVMERRWWLRSTPIQLPPGPCGSRSPYPREGTSANLWRHLALDIENHIGYRRARPATQGAGPRMGGRPAACPPAAAGLRTGAGSSPKPAFPPSPCRTTEAAKTG